MPNLPIFDAARDAICELAQSQRLPYTDVAGMPDVRDICATFVNRMYHTESMVSSFAFGRNNVIITAGAVQAVYNVLALSIDGIDDVVISPIPAYGLYQHQTGLLGGRFDVIPSSLENRFIPTAPELRAIFSRHTARDEISGIEHNIY